MVDGEREGELVFGAAQHVEVGHAGFDHDEIRALADVQRDFVQRFVTVGRVHLVVAFVRLAEVRRRADRVAEGAVVGAGVFGGIRHDAHVFVAVCFQRLADGADAAVHHVRRRDDVHPRVGMTQRLFDEGGDGGVVQDVASFVGDAVLAVDGVGVQRDVGHHAQFGVGGFDRAHRARDEAVRVVSGGGVRAFVFGTDDGKRRYRRNAERDQLRAFGEQQIDGKAVHAGHGWHRLALAFALTDKDGQDEIGGAQGGFAHQAAGEIVLAVAAFARQRERLRGQVHGGVR